MVWPARRISNPDRDVAIGNPSAEPVGIPRERLVHVASLFPFLRQRRLMPDLCEHVRYDLCLFGTSSGVVIVSAWQRLRLQGRSFRTSATLPKAAARPAGVATFPHIPRAPQTR